MKSKIYLFVILIVLLFVLINNVSAANNTGIVPSSNKLSNYSNLSSDILINSITKPIHKVSAKYKAVSKPKIDNISLSSKVVKAGKAIRIKFYPNGYVKSVYSTIDGKKYYFHNKPNKPKYNFNKSIYGYWYYDLSTKGFYTGKYTLKIRATDGSRAYTQYANFSVDNVPPKIQSAKTDKSSILAGTPFTLNAITDSSARKVIAKVKSTTIVLNRINSTHWTINTNISYKYIKKLAINVFAYDAVGNVAKKVTYIISNPKYVYWNGTLLSHEQRRVYYDSPKNDYERAMKEISLMNATIWEGGIPKLNGLYTLGFTNRIVCDQTAFYDVIISYKDPFAVYHEMAHIINWRWSEYTCDEYAYNRTGYWII